MLHVKEEQSEIKPDVVTSIEWLLSSQRLKSEIKSCWRRAYLSILYCLDETALVSWQTVNSRVSIRLASLTTISGRRELNIALGDLYSGMSAKNSQPGLISFDIHWAKMFKAWSCRDLYFGKTDPQFDNTCLLVCRRPHRQHLSDRSFFQRQRFEAVGSCYWKPLRTKRNRISGR